MGIARVYDMIILDTDGTIELSSINFGTLHRGDTKRYPASGHYYIYNLGDHDIFMSFGLTGFPSDVTLTMYFKREDETSYSVLTKKQCLPNNSTEENNTIPREKMGPLVCRNQCFFHCFFCCLQSCSEMECSR